ncbi:MAG: nickel-responsive transcriptional regulator NikR [Verrucomicrobiota bacterium]
MSKKQAVSPSAPAVKSVACRVTLSLPGNVTRQLDELVAAGIHPNRSQAAAKLLAGALIGGARPTGNQVLAGTVTLTYRHDKRGVEANLTKIQHAYLKEVVSSQRVHLARGQTLEVILLQAPGPTLQRIADELIACKGVENGQLYVCSEVLPPLH